MMETKHKRMIVKCNTFYDEDKSQRTQSEDLQDTSVLKKDNSHEY